MKQDSKAHTKRISYLYVGILVIFGISISIAVFPILYSWFDSPKTFEVSLAADENFRSQNIKSANTNSGISICLLRYYDDASQSQAGILAEYAVYNQTQEPIVFPDAGFGLKVFTLRNNLWESIEPVFPFFPEKITLSKDQRVISPDQNLMDNTVLLLYSDFGQKLPAKLRFLVAGIGQKSQISYAAYLDLLLDR